MSGVSSDRVTNFRLNVEEQSSSCCVRSAGSEESDLNHIILIEFWMSELEINSSGFSGTPSSPFAFPKWNSFSTGPGKGCSHRAGLSCDGSGPDSS